MDLNIYHMLRQSSETHSLEPAWQISSLWRQASSCRGSPGQPGGPSSHQGALTYISLHWFEPWPRLKTKWITWLKLHPFLYALILKLLKLSSCCTARPAHLPSFQNYWAVLWRQIFQSVTPIDSMFLASTAHTAFGAKSVFVAKKRENWQNSYDIVKNVHIFFNIF